MRKEFLSACALSLLATTSLSAHDDLGIGYHWSILTEFVYMRRTELHSRTIVDRFDPGKGCPCDERRVMTTKNLLHDFDFEPGYRVGLAYQPDAYWSLEGSFLYLNEWEGHDKKHGHKTLSHPFFNYTSTVDYRNASEAEAVYKSHFYSAELNFWRDVTPRKVDFFSYSWILGLRYIHLNEKLHITFETPPDRSNYNIKARNILGGPQIGGCLEMNPTTQINWSFAAKFGPLADRCEQKTFLGDNNNTIVIHHYTKHGWTCAFLADILASFGFRVTSHFNVRAGYQMIYLAGVALAPEQLSKNLKPHHRKLTTSGNALQHGLFAGLFFSF